MLVIKVREFKNFIDILERVWVEVFLFYEIFIFGKCVLYKWVFS